MDFFQIIQIVYLILHVVVLGILLVALVTTFGWPAIRGRGWLVAALILKLAVAGSFLLMGVVQLASLIGGDHSGLVPVYVIQTGYLVLSVLGVAGDGLLLIALLSLSGALRALRAAPASPQQTPSPWQ
jgi:hypothetical protein